MKLRYKKIEIRLQSGAAIVQRTIPEWEVPVLQAIHNETTELSDVVVDREAPSVAAEYSRLQLAYGAERQEGGITGVSFVEAVYGQHAIGMNALKRAMQGAVLPRETPVTPTDISPTLRQDLLQALSETPSEINDLIGETDDETVAA